MKVDGKPYRTIWLGADGTTVQAIDQTLLPHAFVVRDFKTMEDAERAIRTMIVRGAPLIGAAAAYGMALAMAADPSDDMLARAHQVLLAARLRCCWKTSTERATNVASAPMASEMGLNGRSAVPKGVDFVFLPISDVGEYWPLVRP